MKKIRVCASYTYCYEVEVPDKLCKLDKEGNLLHEADFTNYLTDADETSFDGNCEYSTWSLVSAYNDNKLLYIGD